MRYRCGLVLAVAALAVAACAGGGGGGPAQAPSTQPPSGRGPAPVVFVHGVIGEPVCAGQDVSEVDRDLGRMLEAQGRHGPLVGVSYYCKDRGGPSIDHAGDGHCDSWPTLKYRSNVSIERLACDFAWWAYAKYRADGPSVDIVGHSMGGLIIRYALGQVAAADPRFPPSLPVGDVVTISTPYLGWDKPCCGMSVQRFVRKYCGAYAECDEMLPDSTFLQELAGLPAPAGDWTALGGGRGDSVCTFESASGIPDAHKIDYSAGAPTLYNHTNYLTDRSTARNEPYTLIQPNGASTFTTGPHSLLLIVKALASPHL